MNQEILYSLIYVAKVNLEAGGNLKFSSVFDTLPYIQNWRNINENPYLRRIGYARSPIVDKFTERT
jgi:hypothetical protein